MLGRGQLLLGVADHDGARLEHHRSRIARLRLGDGEIGDRRLGCVGDGDQPRRVVGLLLRLGQHDGHGLAVPVHAIVLHHRQVAAGHAVAVEHHLRRFQARRVAMGHHQGDARGGLGRRGVERGDTAARDRRMHDRRVEQALHRHFRREACLAAHLEGAVEPRERRTDVAVLPRSLGGWSFRPRARDQGVGDMAQHRAQDAEHGHARPPES
jgi:hypothetical protein